MRRPAGADAGGRAAARPGHGALVSYSRKVFIPLTKLCRDSCHYCTFAHPPRRTVSAYLDAGGGAGDRPRRRRGRLPRGAVHARRQAGVALPRGARGARAARPRRPRCPISPRWRALVLEETGLLPHLNPGVMTATTSRAAHGLGVARDDAGDRVRPPVARAAGRISARPTRCRRVRLATIAAAGEAAVPFTTGILIGIGETRRERIEALLALRDLHERSRPHPGDHRPEFPRQARHAHGRARRALAGRPSVDHRGGAADLRTRR